MLDRGDCLVLYTDGVIEAGAHRASSSATYAWRAVPARLAPQRRKRSSAGAQMVGAGKVAAKTKVDVRARRDSNP